MGMVSVCRQYQWHIYAFMTSYVKGVKSTVWLDFKWCRVANARWEKEATEREANGGSLKIWQEVLLQEIPDLGYSSISYIIYSFVLWLKFTYYIKNNMKMMNIELNLKQFPMFSFDIQEWFTTGDSWHHFCDSLRQGLAQYWPRSSSLCRCQPPAARHSAWRCQQSSFDSYATT